MLYEMRGRERNLQLIMRTIFRSVIIGLVLIGGALSCQLNQPKITKPEQLVSVEKEIIEELEVDEKLMISTDSIFRLAVYKTVAVLPDGYDYFYKDSIILTCLELTRVDSGIMGLATFVTESWSRPEYYLTAHVQNKVYGATASYGLFVFEPNNIKFYFCSDAFDNFNDSTQIDIAYKFGFFGNDMNGNVPITIRFNVADFQSKIQDLTNENENYPNADKKWFLSKGIQDGVYRGVNEVYTVE